MKRLRFFRILLPALLIPFLVLVVLEVKRRPQPWGIESGGDDTPGAVVEGVRVVDFEGTDLRLLLEARTTSGDEAEGIGVFESVERLELGREDGSPLVMSAEWVRIEGPVGERKIEIKGGIVVTDTDAGMTIHVPALEVDEEESEARSEGEVRFEAPGYHGTALTLVYRLDDSPSTIFGLEAESDDGGSARADRATLVSGPLVVELEGDVRVARGHEVITAPRMMVHRREDGSLRRVQAFGGVRGMGEPPLREPYWFRSERGDWWFDEAGEPVRMVLEGDAAMQRGSDGLAAEVVRADRRGTTEDEPRADGWELRATGGVFARGIADGAPASLQADVLDGFTDLAFNPLRGVARGNVRFESRGSVAQGARAEVKGTMLTGREIHLYADGPQRARMASERRRVAADLIVTRPGENYLRAEGGVESTLLPAEEDANSPGQGLFDSAVAVHFVSRTLRSEDDGKSLLFEGNVRGWQGERNLAAEKVVYRQAADEMVASGGVTTRMPRVETVAMSEADYVQITGQDLRYAGENGLAVFRDDVLVRQTEGWLECDRLEVNLEGQARSVEVIWAHDNVKLEYRAPGQQGVSRAVHGTADRAEYRLGEDVVRLFGVRSHATVRREGPDAVTTQGRVLLYRLDTGTVQVESGDQDRARIRTSEGGGDPD